MKHSSSTQDLQAPILVIGHYDLRTYLDQDTLAELAAHELREPVQAIRSFLAVLLDGRTGELTELQKDFLLSAKQAAHRAGRRIDDLQLILTDGKMPDFQKRVLDLNASVARCCRELSQVAHERSISLNWEPPTETERLIHGDPDRIDQILLNVLENAIQYSPECSMVAVDALTGPSGHWRLTIENETTGEQTLDPDEWLTPFNRGGRVGGRGLGLGLTVVQTLIQAHNGRFDVIVESGKVRTVLDFPEYPGASV